MDKHPILDQIQQLQLLQLTKANKSPVSPLLPQVRQPNNRQSMLPIKLNQRKSQNQQTPRLCLTIQPRPRHQSRLNTARRPRRQRTAPREPD